MNTPATLAVTTPTSPVRPGKTDEIIPTPVPSSLLLMSVGLLGLARMARRAT